MATTKDLSALVARYEAKIASKPTKADDLQTKLDAKIASLIAKGKTVTIDGATVTSYTLDTSGSDSGGGSSGGVTGSTFLLSTNADEFSPYSTGIYKTTSNDDSFLAGAGRLGTNDYVDGGAGNDTLSVSLDAAVAPVITNVETIDITMRGGSLDMIDVAGETEVNVMGTMSGAVIGLSANATIGVRSGFNDQVRLALDDASGTADAITLDVNGASAFQLQMTGLVERLNIVADTDVVFGNSSNYTNHIFMTGNAGSGLGDLYVSGTANATITLSLGGTAASGATSLSAINASGLDGNMTLYYEIADTIKVVGGDGNDTFYMGSGLDTLDTIDGGAGTDTVRGRVDAGVATVRPTMNNVETLRLSAVSTAATVDLRYATALSKIQVQSTANAIFTNISDSVVTIEALSAAGAPNLDFTYEAGALSDVTFKIGTEGTAAAGATFGDVDFQGNTGALTIGSVGISANVVANLSADVVGSLVINATAQKLGLNDIDAAAANSITLNAAKDLSADDANWVGADTISIVSTGTANVNMDVITVGSGLDTVTINASEDVGISSIVFGDANTSVTGMNVDFNITVGSGANVVIGGHSVASAQSGLTFDYVLAGSGNVSLTFAAGTGTTYTANIDARSLGGSATIVASASTDVAFNVQLGNGSGNVVALGSQSDTVFGGSTADTIQGGGGNDELAGGAGGDSFVYLSNEAASDNAADGVDVITDFGTADSIFFQNLSSLTWMTAVSGGVGGITALANISAVSAGALAVFQRGADVVVQVILTSATAAGGATGGSFVEIILQGETLNTAFTLTDNGADLGSTLTNITVS